MDTNVTLFPLFKYFDNDLSLFQLVDAHFPYVNHVANIRVHLKNSLPDLFVAAERERLGKYYPSLSTWKNIRQMGFVSRIMGHDWPLNTLHLDFDIWKDTEIRDFLKSQNIKRIISDEDFENKFFELLAYGVNDALYFENLTDFRRTTSPSNTVAKQTTKNAEDISPSIKEKKNRKDYAITKILVNLYKSSVTPQIEPYKERRDWIKEKKVRCYNIRCSINNGKRLLKPEEIQAALECLKDFPAAYKYGLKQLQLIRVR